MKLVTIWVSKTLGISTTHQRALGHATLYFLLIMVTVLLRALLTGSTAFIASRTLLCWTWIDVDRKVLIIVASTASGRINRIFLTSLHKSSLDILVYVNLGPDVSEMFIPNSKRLLRNVLLDTPNWRATIFQFWKTSNSLLISSLDITFLGLQIAASSQTGCCVPWISRIRLSTD